MGDVVITRVYFTKDLPSLSIILRTILVETSIHANLSITQINNRSRIDEIYAGSGITILNQEIICYSLWKEGHHALSFSLIEESNQKYIEIGASPYLKTLKSVLIYALVCLGGIKADVNE